MSMVESCLLYNSFINHKSSISIFQQGKIHWRHGSRKIPPWKTSTRTDQTRPGKFPPLKVPRRKFPPGTFPPISLNAFLHLTLRP